MWRQILNELGPFQWWALGFCVGVIYDKFWMAYIKPWKYKLFYTNGKVSGVLVKYNF